MRPAWVALALAVAGLALVVAGSASAEEPRQAAWAPATVEGDPVGAGFVEGEGVVYGTGDAGGLGQDPSVACTVQDGDADLFLFTFPNATGCVSATDASGQQVGSDGLTALASAERRGRVAVGLADSDAPQATDADVVGFDVEDGNLTEAFRRGLGGTVVELATEADGDRFLAAVQTGSGYDLQVLGPDGERLDRFGLRGLPRDVELSENARYAAIGGNYTAQSATFGWARLYDLSLPAGENPVLEREFQRPRGGTVASVAVTDDGRLYTGHLDGEVTLPRTEGTDRTLALANASASVDASPDGTLVAAAAGSTLARLTGGPDRLATVWTSQLNGTTPTVEVRAPYVYALSADVEAFEDRGRPLWTVPGGPVVSVNRTGLGIAVGQTGASGTTGAQTSQLSAREVHRSASIQFPGETPSVSPGGVALVNVSVSNDGAAILNATLTQPDGQEIRVTPAIDRFRQLPGTSRTVEATLTVPSDALPGPRNATVTLESRPPVDASGNVTVEVGSRTSVGVEIEPGTLEDQTVVQGQTVTVRFLVRNEGNAEARVRLGVQQALSQGSTWPIELSPDGTITVPRDTRTTVRMDVTVPEDAADGTRNRIVFRARTDQGVSASTTTLTVNPFESLSLTPQSVTKKVAPGGQASYSFELSNLGSVPANVSLDAQAIHANGTVFVPTEWGVAISRSQVNLDASQSTTVTLELTGPQNATTGESLRVQVLAATDGGARASSVAYGNVDEALAEEPTDEPKRDPIPLWAPLAALLAAGLLLRRGDHDNL